MLISFCGYKGFCAVVVGVSSKELECERETSAWERNGQVLCSLYSVLHILENGIFFFLGGGGERFLCMLFKIIKKKKTNIMYYSAKYVNKLGAKDFQNLISIVHTVTFLFGTEIVPQHALNQKFHYYILWISIKLNRSWIKIWGE